MRKGKKMGAKKNSQGRGLGRKGEKINGEN